MTCRLGRCPVPQLLPRLTRGFLPVTVLAAIDGTTEELDKPEKEAAVEVAENSSASGSLASMAAAPEAATPPPGPSISKSVKISVPSNTLGEEHDQSQPIPPPASGKGAVTGEQPTAPGGWFANSKLQNPLEA